tara:strand:+ start:4579 stop:6198 length:1620 start_codon:yes stop_codon:yes gene_type:complete
VSISLQSLDYAIIAVYFVIVFGIAWAVKTPSTGSDHQSEDYFLAGRNLGWFAIGASLFASNIGSEHLIGLAGAGATSGLAVAQFEILAGFILLILGWVFVPFYLHSGVTTMPEFLEMRYSRTARNYLSFISVIAYVITKISATIFAGAVVFEAMGMDFWIGALVVVLSTGIYTAMGGLRAVIYTDTMQVFVMIAGSILVTYFGIEAIGGFSAAKEQLSPEFFNLWKATDHPEFPWTGILFGAPILGVWYWCTDQFIVQRVLSAKNLSQARKGTLFAGYLKMLPMFLFVVPGMVALVLSQNNQLTLERPDHALPALIGSVLPMGVRGLVMAGLLAALMSSLSSVFNSCSTLITYDFYKVRRPNATDKELFKVGQIATVVLVALGVMWIPLMKYISGGLFTYVQSIQAYISPPIAAVFLLGLLFKRLNTQGALASLATGFIFGVGRLILEINKDSLSGFWHSLATMNFLNFAFFLFVICSAVLIAVSLMTKAPNAAKIEKVCFNADTPKVPTNATEIALSLLLIVLILILWLVFSPWGIGA